MKFCEIFKIILNGYRNLYQKNCHQPPSTQNQGPGRINTQLIQVKIINVHLIHLGPLNIHKLMSITTKIRHMLFPLYDGHFVPNKSIHSTNIHFMSQCSVNSDGWKDSVDIRKQVFNGHPQRPLVTSILRSLDVHDFNGNLLEKNEKQISSL